MSIELLAASPPPEADVQSSEPIQAEPAGSHPAAMPRRLTPGDRRVRIINLGAIIIPFLGLATLAWLSWGTGFDWTQFGIMWVMGITTAIGVTVGYHRLFTHKAFAAPAPVRYARASDVEQALELLAEPDSKAASEETKPCRFIRLLRTDDGELASMDTATVRYTADDEKRKGLTVDLIGAVT